MCCVSGVKHRFIFQRLLLFSSLLNTGLSLKARVKLSLFKHLLIREINQLSPSQCRFLFSLNLSVQQETEYCYTLYSHNQESHLSTAELKQHQTNNPDPGVRLFWRTRQRSFGKWRSACQLQEAPASNDQAVRIYCEWTSGYVQLLRQTFSNDFHYWAKRQEFKYFGDSCGELWFSVISTLHGTSIDQRNVGSFCSNIWKSLMHF